MPETGVYLPAVIGGGLAVRKMYGQWFTGSGATAVHVPVWPVLSSGGKKAELVSIRALGSIDLIAQPEVDLAVYGARFGTNEFSIALHPSIDTLSFRGLAGSITTPVHFRWAVVR